MAIPDQANQLSGRADEDGRHYVLSVGDDETLQARSVVVASGALYRRLDLANLAQFEGSSVHYWASPIEARLCDGQEVALAGAGNSAGRAAPYSASRAQNGLPLARCRSRAATTPHYLPRRIPPHPTPPQQPHAPTTP